MTVVIMLLGFPEGAEGAVNEGRKAMRLMTRSFVAYRDATQRDEMLFGERVT